MEEYDGGMPPRPIGKNERSRESYISVGNLDRFLVGFPIFESGPRRIGARCDLENDS